MSLHPMNGFMLSGGSSKPILSVTFPEAGEGLAAVARDEIRPPITAKAAAAAEEEMSIFSLAVRDLANIRELTGNVHSKEVEVAITTKAGGSKNYRLYMRQYLLQDEVNKISHRGQWKIIRFEPLS